MPGERCLMDAGMPEDQAQAVITWMQNNDAKQAAANLNAWRGGF